MFAKRRRSFWRRIPRPVVLIVMLILLVVNFALMGISFSRYSADFKNDPADSENVGVVSFAPELESGTWNGTLDIPGVEACTGLPFTIKSNGAGISMRVTITIRAEGILPLAYRLFEGENELILTEDNGSFVATVFMPVNTESKNFTLIGEWSDDEYDERFNALSERVQLRVLCEQWQEG